MSCNTSHSEDSTNSSLSTSSSSKKVYQRKGPAKAFQPSFQVKSETSSQQSLVLGRFWTFYQVKEKRDQVQKKKNSLDYGSSHQKSKLKVK